MTSLIDHTRTGTRRTLLMGLFLTLTGVSTQARPAPSAGAAPPPFVVRGLPGPGQEAMRPLAGDWKAVMSLYAALGTPDHPATSDDLRTHREWIAGGRFLVDVTEGTMGGQPYYRKGTLGYSAMDKRFEWVTQDAMNANMMIYMGAKGSGPTFPTSLTGSFTDQGLLGESFAGRSIRQRTVIRIFDNDHHEMLIYFTPPGGKERLVDRKEYKRSL